MQKFLLTVAFVLGTLTYSSAQTQWLDSCCYELDTLVISGDTTACYGDSVQLCVPFDSCLTYQWLYNGDTIQWAVSNCFYAAVGGFYNVVLSNACDTAILWASVSIPSQPLVATISCSAASRTTCKLTANPSGGVPPYTYFWSTLSTTQSIIALSNRSYVVTVTDALGCQTITYGSCANCRLPIIRNAEAGDSNSDELDQTVQIYPVPASAELNVLVPEYLADYQIKVSIISITGQELVVSYFEGTFELNMNIESLEPGVYYLKAEAESFNYMGKISIIK